MASVVRKCCHPLGGSMELSFTNEGHSAGQVVGE